MSIAGEIAYGGRSHSPQPLRRPALIVAAKPRGDRLREDAPRASRRARADVGVYLARQSRSIAVQM
jgi:hypothetical protein